MNIPGLDAYLTRTPPEYECDADEHIVCSECGGPMTECGGCPCSDCGARRCACDSYLRDEVA